MQVGRHVALVAAYAVLAAASLAAVGGCGPGAKAAGSRAAGEALADPHEAAKLHEYQAAVLPTLQRSCLRCHGGMNRRGGLNMSTRANLLQGGKDGAVVIVGRPDDSLLLRVINPRLPESNLMRMPPKGERLDAAEVLAIRRWIADGVVMDR